MENVAMSPNVTLPSRTEPIPASFYDADYFNGITSNYTNGYTWDGLGQMFVAAARFLRYLFPEATRFLDFGAATGLCVRAMREEGMEAWGVEHSPYCLQVAEELLVRIWRPPWRTSPPMRLLMW